MRAYREATKGRVDRREYMHTNTMGEQGSFEESPWPTVRTQAQKDAEARYREKRQG